MVLKLFHKPKISAKTTITPIIKTLKPVVYNLNLNTKFYETPNYVIDNKNLKIHKTYKTQKHI